MKDEKIFLKKLRSRSPSKELENTFITDIFLFINQIKYCEFCKREISKTIKIICDVCKNLNYCIECFLSEKHKHDYHISDNLSFSLFNPDWTVFEEIMFLYGKNFDYIRYREVWSRQLDRY